MTFLSSINFDNLSVTSKRIINILSYRCFLNVFVDFIPSATCDLSLIGLDYGFKTDALKNAMDRFKTNLRSMDDNLKVPAEILCALPYDY